MKITKSNLKKLISSILIEYKDASSDFKPASWGNEVDKAAGDGESGSSDSDSNSGDMLFASNSEDAAEIADKNPGVVVMIADSKKKEKDLNYDGKIITDPNDKRYQYKLDKDNKQLFIIKSPKSNASIKFPDEIDSGKEYDNVIELFN
jgi:uncharacterized protein (DUF2147 family)